MEDGVLSGYWSKIKTVDYNRNQIFIVLLYKKITSKLSGLKHSKCLLSHSAFGVGIPSGLPVWFWLCRLAWLESLDTRLQTEGYVSKMVQTAHSCSREVCAGRQQEAQFLSTQTFSQSYFCPCNGTEWVAKEQDGSQGDFYDLVISAKLWHFYTILLAAQLSPV